MSLTQSTPIGVPDADQITQTLAKLQPDSELQKYAALHKNDPYIMSLANAESNRRKALRAAAAAGQPQAPKVADAAIAGMAPAPVAPPVVAQTQLPENQGIAQIPAPNMQRMADGGIAGYDEGGMADGGSMFDFAQKSEPVLRMAGGGHIPRYQGNNFDGSVVSSNPMYSIPGFQAVSPRAQFTQAGAPENQTLWEQVSNSLQDQGLQRKLQIIEDRMARGIAGPEEKAYYEQLKAKAAGTPQMGATKDTVNPDEVLMAMEKAGRNKAATDKPETSAKDKPAGSSRGQGGQGGSSGQSIKNMYELFAGPKNVRDTELNQIQESIRQQGEAETSAAQRQLNQLKADIADQGEYGKGKEAKLKAKEERIGKEESQAGGLALLEAGLSIMSGTSANPFENIGKGSLVGTAAYRKSMDKIEDAKDKLDDAYSRLEDARFNQKNLNNSELRKATADVDKAANAGLKSLTDFAVTRYGMSRDDAKTMFTGAVQENVANIHANATLGAAKMRSQDQSEYLKAIKGSGAIEQARKNVMDQVIKSNKYTQEEIPAAFEKEWQKTLQMNPALAQLVGTSGGGGAPASGASDFVFNAQTGKLEPRK